MDAFLDSTAADLAAAVAAGEVRAVELVDAVFDRVDRSDDTLHAFLTLTPDVARAQAAEIDRRRTAGEPLGPLAGVPYAAKDLFCTAGVQTTAGSRILDGYVPPYDATVVVNARRAGLVLVGKTNMDEFAMGSSTEWSAYGPTRNPWDTERVPGGSSGGSAACVAARQVPLSLGTDTGGSIRQPAALCGIVGMKPTYGLASRYGIVAFASSLDQAGPFARTVRDCAQLYTAICGPDPFDATSLPHLPPDPFPAFEEGPAGLRVGVLAELEGGGVEPAVAAAFARTVALLEGAGASVREVALPSAAAGLSAYYLIAPAECSSNLARYDGVRYGLRVDADSTEEMHARTRAAGFGPEVKRRIMLGTYALSAGYYDAYYGTAQKARTLIRDEFAAAYEDVDVIVSPTAPGTAFPIGAKLADPLAMYLNDLFTIPTNLTGAPGISVPVGLDDAGLPIGFQVQAPPLGEAVMFRAARAVETLVAFHARPVEVAA